MSSRKTEHPCWGKESSRPTERHVRTWRGALRGGKPAEDGSRETRGVRLPGGKDGVLYGPTAWVTNQI